jgi:hypothetical protein
MTYPDSCEELARHAPCDHSHVDCQHLTDPLDVRLCILPKEHQYALATTQTTRAYKICYNWGYFPAEVRYESRANDEAVVLSGTSQGLLSVPPINKKRNPGIRCRFTELAVARGNVRCEVVCRWRATPASGEVFVDCNVPVQTV